MRGGHKMQEKVVGIALIIVGIIFVTFNKYFVRYFQYLNELFLGLTKNILMEKGYGGNKVIKIFYKLVTYITGVLCILSGVYILGIKV